MKWIKLLADYDGHKSGEAIEVDSAVADALIKTKTAEFTAAPANLDKAADEVAAKLGKLVDDAVGAQVQKQLDAAIAKITPASDPKKRPHIILGKDNIDDDPCCGFKSFGDQILAIKRWHSAPDQRLIRMIEKAPTTYVSEGQGTDGGFALAPNFNQQILEFIFEEDGLLSRADKYTTSTNNLTVPKDETTPWGTNGVQVYWTAEAGQLNQSKLQLGQDNLALQKITALVPVTDEMLQDAFIGLGNYIAKQAGQRIRFKMDEAIVNGDGAGQPLGFNNSGAIVTVPKVSAQPGGTIVLQNLGDMIGRMPQAYLKNLCWLIHPSCYSQMVTMTNGYTSLFVGPGQLKDTGASMGSVLGVPLIISQHCQYIGTPGDIFLVDLSQYLLLTKGSGIETAMSIHLYFDYNVSTFRFNFRVTGKPWMSAPFTAQYGTNYQMSPFVNLAAR